MIFLFFINYIYAKLIYLISLSTFRFLTKILQLVDVEIIFLLYIKILLYFCGDIDINPGPTRSSLTFYHWNLNGVAAHEFIKVSLLQGYITERNFDIIWYLKPSLILLLTVKMIGEKLKDIT